MRRLTAVAGLTTLAALLGACGSASPSEPSATDVAGNPYDDGQVADAHTDGAIQDADADIADAGNGDAGNGEPADAADLGDALAPGACPIPVFEVLGSKPKTAPVVINLSALGSKSATGTIASYAWTVKGPAGMCPQYGEHPKLPTPSFTAARVGDYEFCLEVVDSARTKSCKNTCKTVTVSPNNGIHVELTWQSPLVPDLCDGSFAMDLDLHFAHPLALGPDIDCDKQPDPWFSNPFDVFWFNPKPKWGSPTPGTNDDPLLTPDATGRHGEVLTLPPPPTIQTKPLVYRIGVHAWNLKGSQEARATVKTWVQGKLIHTAAAVPLHELDMWNVGRVHWPSKTINGKQVAMEPCHQSKAPCQGGKQWLAAGDRCITQCYVNPAFAATQSGGDPKKCKVKP